MPQTNKEAGLMEPDVKTIESLENIKKLDTLNEKLKQIGKDTHFLAETCDFILKDLESNDRKEIDNELNQLFGNIHYYMFYLRGLVTECPEPLKHSMVLTMDEECGTLSFIKKLDTLAEKIEQIGMEVHFWISECDYILNYDEENKVKTYPILKNIVSYMDYLIELET